MDLDFGVTRWYLKPTFVLKVLYVILSVVIAIYLFYVCTLLSNQYFKTMVSRAPIVVACFLAISMICSLCSFIILIFRMVSETQYFTLVAL